MPRHTRRLLPLCLLGALVAPASATAPTPITLEQAMADPDWIGPPVEQAWWRWDNQAVFYTLKREGSPIRDTYRQGLADAQGQPLGDAALADQDATAPVYDRERRRMVFVRNGDVFLRDLASGQLQQLTRSEAEEAAPQLGADSLAVQWRVGNDWFRWSADAGVAIAAQPRAEKDPGKPAEPDALGTQVLRLSTDLSQEKRDRETLAAEAARLRRADPTRPAAPIYLGDAVSLADSSLSPDGRWLLAVAEPKGADAGRVGKMPKYLTESGYEEVEDVRTRVGRNAPVAQSLRLLDLASGEVREIALDALPGIGDDPLAALRKAAGKDPLSGPRGVRVAGLQWNRRGDRLAVQLRSIDNKDRWLALLDPAKPRLQPLHRLHDPAWINWNFNEFGWLADDRTLWLASEESGYSHLYTVAPGQPARALNDGPWEASAPQLSADGKRLFFLCNRAWPGDYEVCAQDVDGGAVAEITALDGVEDFSLSPDGAQLLVRYSTSYLPTQIAQVPAKGGAARTLTDTRKPEYAACAWIEPRFVQIPSQHGAGTLWGKFYRPAALEPGRKYPLVLFVHGAGYTQNAHARFPYYFREQMFHNLLVQQGYLVLDLDYRASEGYGRDWRTAIYRQMGHPELDDYLDGIDWLVREQQGDRERVGIYGGSYGGFMTLMALFRAPEAFKAGAALRPVSDWTSYNHEYTSNILNTPELDPEAYRVSSPIEYADRLQGRLLIAHGMIDDNVMYQDSVRLSQRLIELHKGGWEMASYPLERHAYQHADSWYDQYRRIDELFERTLK